MLAVWIGIVDAAVLVLFAVRVAWLLSRHPAERLSSRWLLGRNDGRRWWLDLPVIALCSVLGVMCSHLSWVAGLADLTGVFAGIAVLARIAAVGHNRNLGRRLARQTL